MKGKTLGRKAANCFSSPDEGQNTRLGSGELFFIGTMKDKTRDWEAVNCSS
ncbi:hypothetical protein B4098_0348 [Heyndrickxia coagulans]|uniref:Uncharacterized protein n=1 Tax=Heyndrickxia coagulans TaxID=1398 RepID=A0A150JV68_HEYCO|nr:hypothetical protein B4098_0348 [Heyndrickxia coagulans]KYC63149.1 hypothetical protein B4100_0309 [Heyndrickxia coagulans]